MESTFVWIVLFAGAAIALLGVFLVASERELKKKRQEVELLVTKLGDTTTASAAPTIEVAPSAADTAVLAELQVKNQELEKELGTAQEKLEISRRAIEELETDQRRIDATQSNAQWLQTANDQMKAEIDDLKNQLQASEARGHSNVSPSPDTMEQQRALESEIAELQNKLADSMTHSRESEELRQKLANFESMEVSYRDERQKLENKISELAREAASTAAQLADLDTLRLQLADAEQSREKLDEERRGFEQELQRWQTHAAEDDEQRRRFAALQQPFDQLVAKHATMEEQQRDFQEAWTSFAHLMNGSESAVKPSVTTSEPYFSPAPVDSRTSVDPDTLASQPTIAAPEQIVAAAQTQQKSKRRFGIFPAVIVVVAAGALSVGLWRSQSNESTKPVASASALPVRLEPKTTGEPKPAAVNSLLIAKEPLPIVKVPAAENTESLVKATIPPARTLQKIKAETAAAGTYETTQASRVYAAPSEFSQQVGDIAPGTKVTVVNNKNGWLEIHSKYGRPPGFIRKEAARIALQE